MTFGKSTEDDQTSSLSNQLVSVRLGREVMGCLPAWFADNWEPELLHQRSDWREASVLRISLTGIRVFTNPPSREEGLREGMKMSCAASKLPFKPLLNVSAEARLSLTGKWLCYEFLKKKRNASPAFVSRVVLL